MSQLTVSEEKVQYHYLFCALCMLYSKKLGERVTVSLCIYFAVIPSKRTERKKTAYWKASFFTY